jgi:glutamate dehydrogenase
MRNLRKQLIDALTEARKRQRLPVPAPRLAATLIHDFIGLLLESRKKRTVMHWRQVSHEHLHRHVFTIRCPDQAFYLDAIKGYFARRGIQPLEQQTMVFHLESDERGHTTAIHPPDGQKQDHFMLIAIHVSATLLPEGKGLARDLNAVLHAVDASVRDFPAMHAMLYSLADHLESDTAEAAELLRWIGDNRYIFFGMQTQARKLGLFRNRQVLERIVAGLADEIGMLEPAHRAGVEWLHFPASQHYLYSAAALETVRISWKENQHLVSAILLGHFSRSARHANASRIPVLRQHWKKLLKTPLLAHSAFYRREIRTLFDRLPKSLLLSTPCKAWPDPLKAFADLTGPVQTHTTLFNPAPGTMHIVLASLPADRFGPNVLKQIFNAFTAIGLTPYNHESIGIGSHRILLIPCTSTGKPDARAVSEAIQEAVIFWKDLAKTHVLQHAKVLDIPATLARLERLPPVYQNLFPPEQFISDMRALNWVRTHNRTRVHIRKAGDGIDIQIFTCKPQPLGQLVSTIQAFGLTAMREAVVEFKEDDTTLYLSSLHCTYSGQKGNSLLSSERKSETAPFLPEDSGRLTLALDHVMNGEADDDIINSLVLSGALDIQQVAVIAALRGHLVQLMPDAAPLLLTDMLNRHAAVTARLYRMFEARHRPAMPSTYTAQVRREFDKAMESVKSLTDDRWFRALAELVESGLRTNAYARDPWDPVTIKINPSKLSYVPKPVPYREIFVHGVHVEGVHLRGGPISRGGLRYSDRPADFRTEVLELMATQVVKNGQIVPTGAKGGFVVRCGCDEAFVRKQYRIFVRALLALTDNLVHGEAEPPIGIRIPPDDVNDPYLVVAADKGTARYSDFANEEARLAGFWLDDAFASGGMHGYDHKVVGITARGAWVCAAQHFATMGMDAYKDAITVVGIGDMGGDVFGNGMLINPNIHLLAAFNHKHIFLDPLHDPAKASAERRRMFEQGLGWDAYDSALIGSGGGVFERTAKKIPISTEIKEALAIKEDALSGEALIQAILTAPVDMLYNGGIGTYVKGSSESDAEVRDPANNAVRVTADALRCTVVCEGGNLGFTQTARLEYATGGGHINTDAIDNSAGVDMSDHEVNLKILFSEAGGQSLTMPRRNRILRSLTDSITEQCLDDNLQQSRALTLAELESGTYPPRMHRLRDVLLGEDRIDPLTDPGMDVDETLLLRPQLAVLLGHEKNRIHERLADCCFVQNDCFRDSLLQTYFPTSIRKRFSSTIEAHPLASEIIHTMAANHTLNHFGLGSVHHLETLIDNPTGEIVLGLLMAEYMLDGDVLRHTIWQEIEDTDIACQIQRAMQEHLIRFAEEMLRLCPVSELTLDWIKQQRKGLRHFRHSLAAQGIGGMENSRFLGLLKTVGQAGLDPAHAAHLATMPELSQTATSLHLSSTLAQPLPRCLKANQACLHLLPFYEAESPLRTATWGDEDTHALRREWLHRLTMLKSQAIRQLLTLRHRDLLQAGETLWAKHRHWDNIQHLRAELDENEPDRMKLLLLLARLESLITESEIR